MQQSFARPGMLHLFDEHPPRGPWTRTMCGRRLVGMLGEAGVAIPEDLLARLRKLGGPLSGIEVSG